MPDLTLNSRDVEEGMNFTALAALAPWSFRLEVFERMSRSVPDDLSTVYAIAIMEAFNTKGRVDALTDLADNSKQLFHNLAERRDQAARAGEECDPRLEGAIVAAWSLCLTALELKRAIHRMTGVQACSIDQTAELIFPTDLTTQTDLNLTWSRIVGLDGDLALEEDTTADDEFSRFRETCNIIRFCMLELSKIPHATNSVNRLEALPFFSHLEVGAMSLGEQLSKPELPISDATREAWTARCGDIARLAPEMVTGLLREAFVGISEEAAAVREAKEGGQTESVSAD